MAGEGFEVAPHGLVQLSGRLTWRGEQLNAVADGVVRALGSGATAAGDEIVAGGIATFSNAWGTGLGGLAAVVEAIGAGVKDSSASYVATDQAAADRLAGLDGA
jgi:hypothetical protein